jgi:GT2 family glycosyltransferase
MPDPVDVVMLTWNKLDLTRQAVRSYRRHVRHPYRLICVDNGSTDGTLDYLRTAADLVIANSSNVGAVRARNQGYAVAASELVLFSDNDIEFECDVVARLVAAMEREPRLGMVAPLLNQHLEEIGQYPHGASLSEITAEIAASAPPSLLDPSLLVAACVMFRRGMIDEVGGWDTAFDPYGHEDFDFTLRARARGWRASIALDCYVHHYGTGARALPEREALVERNRQRLIRRWGLRAGDNLVGIVEPYELPAERGSEGTGLGRQLKLLERHVAACRLPSDWPARTERFVAELPHTGQDVLAVGCGSGDVVKELRHRYGRQAVGLVPGLSRDQLYGVRQGYGYDLPFEDESFDAVVARHSLEHSPMPLVNLLETARVLRPSGLAILAVPAAGGLSAEPHLPSVPLTDPQCRTLLASARLTLLHADTDGAGDGGHRYIARKAGQPGTRLASSVAETSLADRAAEAH